MEVNATFARRRFQTHTVLKCRGQRVDNAGDRAAQGLSTVRAIVLEHGGEITLGNRKEGGLRVSVVLPVAPG